jgi:5,10-methylenetetrahydromethanopterin reductase
MAAFLASIDSLTGGRGFMDIASGDSAVLNIGYRIASRARIEDYVQCIRSLMASGEAKYQGRPQRVRWTSRIIRDRVPISICAEGPRMLHLGGRIGDGVIAGTGLLPEVIAGTVEKIRAGARDAGRDPSDVDIWFTTRTSLHEDNDKAIDNVKASVSSILNHSMRSSLEGKHVPEGLKTKLQEYVDGYVLYEHVLSGGTNPRRMEELGLTDYALKRFALAGNPEAWIARIEEISQSGATKLWLNAEGGNLDRQLHYMRLLGDRVLKRFV